MPEQSPLTEIEAFDLAHGLKAVLAPDEGVKAAARWMVKRKLPREQADLIIETAVENWKSWQGVAGLIEIQLAATRHERRDFSQPPSEEQIEQWKREGASHDPNFRDTLLRMNGRSTDEQWRQFRIENIRYALKRADGWWGSWLAQTAGNHPDEVAALRAGREPAAPVNRAPVVEISSNRPSLTNPITAADLAAAPRLRIERCELCEGTGRLTDAYCTCQLGQDLERFEEKQVAARLEPDYIGGPDGDAR